MKQMLYMLLTSVIFSCAALAQEGVEDQPFTVAILDFSERGAGVKDSGAQVGELMFVNLVTNSKLWLVERKDLEKILTESELNLSGAVNPKEAIQVGQLTGAKILISGSVFKVRDKTYIVAKIIGTETSRVLGASVNGTGDLDGLVVELGEKVNKLFEKDVKKLMPKIKKRKDVLEELKKVVGDVKGQTVYINIEEEHLRKEIIDPAAKTEFQVICKELGFEVTEIKSNADYIISGEGFSEFATRHKNLVSVKARLEVKITDQKGNVLAVGRQTDVAIDLAEAIASKTALQSTALKLAERLLPKISKK